MKKGSFLTNPGVSLNDLLPTNKLPPEVGVAQGKPAPVPDKPFHLFWLTSKNNWPAVDPANAPVLENKDVFDWYQGSFARCEAPPYWVVTAGWSPAFDPKGQFEVELHRLYGKPLLIRRTRSLAEAKEAFSFLKKAAAEMKGDDAE